MDRPYQWNGAWMFTDENNRGMWDPRKLILLPRVGVALRLNDRMSLRAGFARFNTPVRAAARRRRARQHARARLRRRHAGWRRTWKASRSSGSAIRSRQA